MILNNELLIFHPEKKKKTLIRSDFMKLRWIDRGMKGLEVAG